MDGRVAVLVLTRKLDLFSSNYFSCVLQMYLCASCECKGEQAQAVAEGGGQSADIIPFDAWLQKDRKSKIRSF